MKKYTCLFISCLIIIPVLFAQNTAQYRWGARTPILKECDEFGREIPNSFVRMEPHAYFWVTNKKDENTVIATLGPFADIDENGIVTGGDFIKFQAFNLNRYAREDLRENRVTMQNITRDYVRKNKQYFLVPLSTITNDAMPVYVKGCKSHRLTIGATTLPFKLRQHNFDFAKDLNVGSVIGINRRTHQTKNNFINYLFNISVSVNDLDNLSARNIAADQLPAKNIAALTLAGGLVWQSGKGQVGVFYGFDFMSHNNWTKYRWVYNKRPWIGIGFGINLFQREDLNAGPGDEITNYKKKKKVAKNNDQQARQAIKTEEKK